MTLQYCAEGQRLLHQSLVLGAALLCSPWRTECMKGDNVEQTHQTLQELYTDKFIVFLF